MYLLLERKGINAMNMQSKIGRITPQRAWTLPLAIGPWSS